MKGHYILYPELIQEHISQMTFISKSDDGSDSLYLDPVKSDRWLLTRFNNRTQGGGWPVVKLLPLLSLEECIDLAMNSIDDNDIVGAALELRERESEYVFDFRGLLVHTLEGLNIGTVSDVDRKRIHALVTNSSLTDPTNKWDPLEKKYARVHADADYFKSIAKRAEQIVHSLDHSS